MKVSIISSQKFIIRHSDGLKTMAATCIAVNPTNNTMWWQFKHQNGASKYFNMFDKGLDFYASKGW